MGAPQDGVKAAAADRIVQRLGAAPWESALFRRLSATTLHAIEARASAPRPAARRDAQGVARSSVVVMKTKGMVAREVAEALAAPPWERSQLRRLSATTLRTLALGLVPRFAAVAVESAS